MKTINQGGPAFPTPGFKPNEVFYGLTVRDYFAAKAMQAFISAYPCQAIDRADGGIPVDHDSIAGDAYDVADAMLAAREAK
jgi:hypothetical protein